MQRKLNSEARRVLALCLLCTPCAAQEVQLDFGIQGAFLRSNYDGIEELEHKLGEQLMAHCKDDEYLRYWTMLAPVEGAAVSLDRPAMDVALILEDDVLRVRLDVRSAFLSGLSGITTRFSERLLPPGELQRSTTRGAPHPNVLPEHVSASFEALLQNNRSAVFSIMTQGCPLGRFGHEFAPRLNEDGQRFEMVLPIDVSDERNCFLRTSVFELKCESSRSTDTRLDSRGTGFDAEYPPQSVPAEQRTPGVAVTLEQMRIGTGSPEVLATGVHAELMRSVRPRFFFLRELNEGAHTCFGDISMVQ